MASQAPLTRPTADPPTASRRARCTGSPVIVFGLFNGPMIAPANRALSDQLLFVYRWTGVTIACLVTVHIAAAIYHHFVRRDRVLMPHYRLIAKSTAEPRPA